MVQETIIPRAVLKLKFLIPILAITLLLKSHGQDLLTTIDFNDAAGTHAARATATNNFFSNALDMPGFVTKESGQAVWAYDSTANSDPDLNDQFKIRTFTSPLTEAAYSSVTLQFKVDFNLINTTTKSAKLGFGLTNGATKVAETRIAHAVNGHARPESIINDSGVASFNPSDNGATNWGLSTGGNGLTITTKIDFENDQIILSYNNGNNSDGEIIFATEAYTGTSIDGLRFSVAGNDLFADGDGAFFSVDQLTISGTPVHEPAQSACIVLILSMGAVFLRRGKAWIHFR